MLKRLPPMPPSKLHPLYFVCIFLNCFFVLRFFVFFIIRQCRMCWFVWQEAASIKVAPVAIIGRLTFGQMNDRPLMMILMLKKMVMTISSSWRSWWFWWFLWSWCHIKVALVAITRRLTFRQMNDRPIRNQRTNDQPMKGLQIAANQSETNVWIISWPLSRFWITHQL